MPHGQVACLARIISLSKDGNSEKSKLDEI